MLGRVFEVLAGFNPENSISLKYTLFSRLSTLCGGHFSLPARKFDFFGVSVDTKVISVGSRENFRFFSWRKVISVGPRENSRFSS